MPDGIHGCPSPKLSKRKAWSVIWLLSVHPDLADISSMPDHVEICDDCGAIYDTNAEGCYCGDASDCKEYGVNAKAKWKHLCGGCFEDRRYDRRDRKC